MAPFSTLLASDPFENTWSFLGSRDQFIFCNIGSHPEKNTNNKSNTIFGNDYYLFLYFRPRASWPTFTLSTYLLQLIIEQHLLSDMEVFGWKPQIREQMCLETHFQYEFSILGCFGQSGLQRKKIQTTINILLLRPVFFMISWTKINSLIFLKIP